MSPPLSLALQDRLIVALDLPSVSNARSLVDLLGEEVSFYKIGYRLAYADGLPFVRELVRAGKKVFLDLKLHDIGNTVEEGVRSISELGVHLLTVHAYPQTMRAAVKGRAKSDLRLLAVTVLTSYDQTDLQEAGFALSVDDLVMHRALQARDIGIDGLVCAPTEAKILRKNVSSSMLIVTPGIRPLSADQGDQKRSLTPAQAIKAGADLLVVGRPITNAPDPREAAAAIQVEIAEASSAL